MKAPINSNKIFMHHQHPHQHKEDFMALKPGPKPIAKSTGEVDKRRRDNKDTQGNNPDLKPSKSSKK
ncbi:hypothetical protein KH389_16260 [Pseudomonas qingdaonensis]|uniref:Uncharacterized protein n=2 Tax=Pseudomonas TaxID=286 RepID=A0ABX8DZG8_9PSED|nr:MULTISPECIES: hypothetical protein [Pseudomonas]MDD1955649.1 hypothetical protein [Pseudomonas sp. 8209]QVL21741.1 hypothetical protein KH389_16260 [Pseudomonas qingdaonensis]